MKMLPNAITTSTRNWLGRLFLLAGAVAGVLACEEPKEIGLSPTTPVGILYTDTLTITRETILLDSVRSNDQSTLLVGRYTDPVFGDIRAKAFVQTRFATDFVVTDSLTKIATVPARIIYDSTRLVLDLNGAWYGDTTLRQEIQVFRLTDSLRQAQSYDISSVVSSETTPLARQTIRPRPTARDSAPASFVLPDTYGRQLLAIANTDAGKVANNAAFQAQFRSGLLLTSDATARAAVLGFQSGAVSSNTIFGSYVAVYYHVQGETTRRTQFLLLNGKRFNQIIADRSGTALARLQKGVPLPAAATGGFTYSQPATGVVTKLSFPSLKNLSPGGRVAINRADLIITPTTPTNLLFTNPGLLVLAEVDERNQLRRLPVTGTGIAAFGGFPFFVPDVGPLDRTAVSFAQTRPISRNPLTNTYTFQMGGYFQSIVANVSPNTGLALLSPGSDELFAQDPQTGGLSDQTRFYLTDRLWRMIMDDKASVKLIMFYTTST